MIYPITLLDVIDKLGIDSYIVHNMPANEETFNSTYLDQHKAILDNDFSKICSLDEGMKVMEMIDSVQKVRER